MPGIRARMLPLAASSGLAIAGGVILAAILLLWWLLRAELREEAAAEQEAEHGRPAPARPILARPAPTCRRARRAGRLSKRSSGTSHIASAAIRQDILLVPSWRSRNTIGTSTTLKPACTAR